MYFCPFVIQADTGMPVCVSVDTATQADLDAMYTDPVWQTNWTSEYLSAASIDKFAVKTPDGELVALGAYQIRGRQAYMYILYAESAPYSNPTMTGKH